MALLAQHEFWKSVSERWQSKSFCVAAVINFWLARDKIIENCGGGLSKLKYWFSGESFASARNLSPLLCWKFAVGTHMLTCNFPIWASLSHRWLNHTFSLCCFVCAFHTHEPKASQWIKIINLLLLAFIAWRQNQSLTFWFDWYWKTLQCDHTSITFKSIQIN